MSPEEAKAERERQERAILASWRFLATNKEFQIVFERDLQPMFRMFGASFLSEDGFNPHAAAKRDGNKEVLNYIAKRLGWAKASMDDDASPPPPQSTVFEFGKA